MPGPGGGASLAGRIEDTVRDSIANDVLLVVAMIPSPGA